MAVSTCRICLDEISPDSEGVMRLGCSCSEDLMHRSCAVAWFRISNRNTCEVCNQVVTGIPSLAAERAPLPTRPPEPRSIPITATWITRRLEQGGLGSFSVQAFLIHYAFLCLIPAVASSAIFAFYLVWFVLSPENPYFALIISIPLSLGPVGHWIFFPREPVVHICGCVYSLGVTILVTLLLSDKLKDQGLFPEVALLSIGALCGSISGFIMFHTLILPLFRVLCDLQKILGNGTVRLAGASSNPQQQEAGLV
jgi:hypothetical protein